jgi:hypothetical protein
MAFQGGLPFFNDAVGGTVVNIKSNGFADLLSMKLVNTTAAVAYLQVFDAPAASVTLGTTVPKFVVRLAASETTNPSEIGILQFRGTGLSIAGTTTAGGSTGAVISVSATFG